MSIDLQAVLVDEADEADGKIQSDYGAWVGTALTALFAAAAVLFVSFLSVVTSL